MEKELEFELAPWKLPTKPQSHHSLGALLAVVSRPVPEPSCFSVKWLSGLAPAILVAAGISSSLSTTRLLAALDDALKQPQLANDPDGAIGTALLLLDVQASVWVRHLEQNLQKTPKSQSHRRFDQIPVHGSIHGPFGRVDDPRRLVQLISDLEPSGVRSFQERHRSPEVQKLAGNKGLNLRKTTPEIAK